MIYAQSSSRHRHFSIEQPFFSLSMTFAFTTPGLSPSSSSPSHSSHSFAFIAMRFNVVVGLVSAARAVPVGNDLMASSHSR